MLRFGFELEGFFKEGETITLPPKNYPTDGFPGLCEVRTVGGDDLTKAYYALLMAFAATPFDTKTVEHTFSPSDKRVLRSRDNLKTAVTISNVYDKEPRALGNRTIASFQINISRLVTFERVDKEGIRWPPTYGLFDYVPIIRALDKEFEKEITDAKRQKGFYSVKDGNRVEYRSLPNSVFEPTIEGATKLLKRIRKCVE